MRFRGTFPAGFAPLVRKLLLRDLPLCAAETDESSVIYRADASHRRPAYFQGRSFVLAECASTDPSGACEALARKAWESGADDLLGPAGDYVSGRRGGGRPRSFALRVIRQGEPTAVGQGARAALEGAIRDRTGRRPDSERPDAEFQVQLRTEGKAYLLLSDPRGSEDRPERGALPQSTARLLCELSRPGAEDVFLDPFMGSGAIPLERARMGPYGMIFAGDQDEGKSAAFKAVLGRPEWAKRRRTIFPKVLDARDLGRFESGFFSAIVTDPPWGLYEKLGDEELLELYVRFLREARRVLARDGRLVLLTGRELPLEKALGPSGSSWNIVEDYGVLISGRKARCAVLEDRNGD